MTRILLALLLMVTSGAAFSATVEVTPQTVVEWKLVYGQVETRNRVPARARIGGTIIALDTSEGDQVTAGTALAMIEDTKLNFQIAAFDARLVALQSQLATAQADLTRGQDLHSSGVITTQRLEALENAVNVLQGEITGTGAERLIVEQQIAEGVVMAPGDGIVLAVPVSLGSVVAPGEAIAEVGGGGVFLRLSVPERHAGDLAEGDVIEIGGEGEVRFGTLVKLYPQIEGGRVQADVEVDGLDPRFVGRRVPVRLPVGERQAILVPAAALTQSGGLDFVTVETAQGPVERVVVPGATHDRDGTPWREILTGLVAGDRVVTGDE